LVALKGRASFVLAFVAAAGCGSVGSPDISDASACQPVTLAAPACNNLQNVASPIHAVLHSGTGVLGGPIGELTDGIYRATALDGYRGAADTEVRDTVAVTQGGTVLLWASQVFDTSTGAATTHVGNVTELAAPASDNYEISCGTVPFAPFQVMLASADGFTTFTQPPVNGDPVFEETFTLADCAPGD
jgi:hypothetical protein